MNQRAAQKTARSITFLTKRHCENRRIRRNWRWQLDRRILLPIRQGHFCFFETIIGGPAMGKTTRTEFRFYVKDGRPIKTMEGMKIVNADKEARKSIETANKIFKAYVTKDFVGALCD